jgi:S-adenosylmethionine synthetase
MGIYVNTYGTSKVNKTDAEIAAIIEKLFDMRPAAIEKRLKLRQPMYSETASYGHMGRENITIEKTFRNTEGTIKKLQVELFTWEKLDFVTEIQKYFNI